jgi:hypothetical protein
MIPGKIFDAGKKTKSELVYAAERYEMAVKGINDQPSSGGHDNISAMCSLNRKQPMPDTR